MPLTLEQYAAYLDTRADLSWPAAPVVDRPKARPHLVRLPQVRVVLWNVYGTLLAISGGELLFEHPQPFIMSLALDRTLQEFKMWGSMSRKPGQPADYLGKIYAQVLAEQRTVTGGAGLIPEVAADQVWESILKKLLQKDYQFDAGFFGSLNEFSRKVAYFFHASLQGTAGYPGLAQTLQHLATAGLTQGVLADGQYFTLLQLQRAVNQQVAGVQVTGLLDPGLCWLSYELRCRKPGERLLRSLVPALAQRGLRPDQVLHVGTRMAQDLVPARRLGLRTALFAGDRASLQATPEQLKESATRPDVLLTELNQLTEVLG